MTKILIVDSDTVAREQVAQDLGAERAGWRVLQADSSDAAMQLLEESARSIAIDVVISESRLRDVSSAEFLEEVRQLDERIIRLTLTANAESEAEMGNARANQRFLLKPFKAAHLATTIERSLRLRDTMHDPSLKRFMSTVSSVPALPAIYDAMMAELASAHSSLLKVGEIVESDTGLTLTVLKVVNSAFYGINKRVESVGQAVTLLGVHLIKNITLTTKVFSKFKGSTVSASRLTELNNEAMKLGALANQFARYARLPRGTVDHCQIAGMMANVGELVSVSTQGKAGTLPAMSTEIIGANILHSWNMPDNVVEAVALQHETPPKGADVVSPLVVLNSIRYLQTHFTRTSDRSQESECRRYLEAMIPSEIVEKWIDAFRAVEELTNSSKAA